METETEFFLASVLVTYIVYEFDYQLQIGNNLGKPSMASCFCAYIPEICIDYFLFFCVCHSRTFSLAKAIHWISQFAG